MPRVEGIIPGHLILLNNIILPTPHSAAVRCKGNLISKSLSRDSRYEESNYPQLRIFSVLMLGDVVVFAGQVTCGRPTPVVFFAACLKAANH